MSEAKGLRAGGRILPFVQNARRHNGGLGKALFAGPWNLIFDGYMPTQLGGMDNLQFLLLNDNKLSGNIPRFCRNKSSRYNPIATGLMNLSHTL